MKYQSSKRILLAMGAATLLGIRPAVTQAEAIQHWSIASDYPANTVAGHAIKRFAELANQDSDGWLKVTPEFALSSRDNTAQLVSSGQLEIGDAFSGVLSHLDPLFELSMLPFQVQSVEQAHELADLARPAYAKKLQAHGLHLLFITPWPGTGLWSRRTLGSDIQALRIRTYDNSSAKVLSQLGAQANAYPIQQVGHLIQAGELDGVLSSGDGAVGTSFAHSLPNFTAINYAFPLSFVFLSNSKYDALTDAQQAQLDAAAATTEREQWQSLRSRIEQNHRNLALQGVRVAPCVDSALANNLQRTEKASLARWRARVGAQEARILDHFQRQATREKCIGVKHTVLTENQRLPGHVALTELPNG